MKLTLWSKILSGSLCAGVMVACGPSPYDLYLDAIRAQGRAERGTCRMRFSADQGMHTINSGQVARCVRDLKEVRALYEKAIRAGYSDKEMGHALEKIDEDLGKLESMQAMVSEMEMDD